MCIKYRTRILHTNIFCTDKFFNCICLQTCRSGTALCVSSRQLCRLIFVEHYQQSIVHKISNSKINIIFNHSHHSVFNKISPTNFPPWRRYTFLSHLTTKSKISVRWIKKLVAATFCVQKSYIIISLSQFSPNIHS